LTLNVAVNTVQRDCAACDSCYFLSEVRTFQGYQKVLKR